MTIELLEDTSRSNLLEGYAVKLDHLPLDVLHALQEVATETARNDREAMRRANAGMHVSFPVAERQQSGFYAGPALPMPAGEERPAGKVIVLDFSRARAAR